MNTFNYEEMAAEYSHIPPATFRKWRSLGRLKPMEYVGKSPRFARADVEECVKNYKPACNPNRAKKITAAKKAITLELDLPADDGRVAEETQARVEKTDSNFQYTDGRHLGEVKHMETNTGAIEHVDSEIAADDVQSKTLDGQADNAGDTNAAEESTNEQAEDKTQGSVEEISAPVESPASMDAANDDECTEEAQADESANVKDTPMKGKEIEVAAVDDTQPAKKITLEEAKAAGWTYEQFMANQAGLSVEAYMAKEAAEQAELATREEQRRIERIESLKEQIRQILVGGRIPILVKDLHTAAEHIRELIDAGQNPIDSTDKTTQAAFSSAEYRYKELAEYQVALAECKEELARLGVEETVGANQSFFPSEEKTDATPADDDATDAREIDSGNGSSEGTAADNQTTLAPGAIVESLPFRGETTTLEQRAENIRQLVAGVGYNMIQIGRELIEAKKQCGHGRWAQWLKENFRWSQRKATTYMQIAVRFGNGKSDVFRFGLYTVEALLALPARKVETFIETQAAAGKPIEDMTVKEVRKAVKQFNDETQGEVKGDEFYNLIERGNRSNTATVEEMNRAIETREAESLPPAAVNKLDTGNETIAPVESPASMDAANDDERTKETQADESANVKDTPMKGKEVEARVKDFSHGVETQLEDIRRLAEESIDMNAVKLIQVALLKVAQSANAVASSLNGKIDRLVEANMPTLPGMD